MANLIDFNSFISICRYILIFMFIDYAVTAIQMMTKTKGKSKEETVKVSVFISLCVFSIVWMFVANIYQGELTFEKVFSESRMLRMSISVMVSGIILLILTIIRKKNPDTYGKRNLRMKQKT